MNSMFIKYESIPIIGIFPSLCKCTDAVCCNSNNDDFEAIIQSFFNIISLGSVTIAFFLFVKVSNANVMVSSV